MEPVLKSEIFFFISSVAVILFTVVFIIFGFYLIKIMRNFSHISDKLKKGVDNASASLEEVGENIKESKLFSFIFGSQKKNKKSRN